MPVDPRDLEPDGPIHDYEYLLGLGLIAWAISTSIGLALHFA